MTGVERQEQDAPGCPKRLWVMMTLSDDEALAEDGTLPRGLQFHLSRCASCRALADQLLGVSTALRCLSASKPDVNLADRADAQALTALREGAKLTGRVSIPDEPEPIPTAPARGGWSRLAQYAAAAAVFIAVGLFGLLELRGPQDPTITGRPEPPRARIALSPVQPQPVEPTEVPVEPDERIAQVSRSVEPAVDVATGDRRSRRTCRHHSHVEAALCDDTHCIHRALILPRRRSTVPKTTGDLQRMWAAFRGFDSTHPPGSTRPVRSRKTEESEERND